jgi:hypothetical protein
MGEIEKRSPMKTRNRKSPNQCQSCKNFYGEQNIICGMHPYGPESRYCPDFVSSPLPKRSHNFKERGIIYWSYLRRHFFRYCLAFLVNGVFFFGVFCVMDLVLTGKVNFKEAFSHWGVLMIFLVLLIMGMVFKDSDPELE